MLETKVKKDHSMYLPEKGASADAEVEPLLADEAGSERLSGTHASRHRASSATELTVLQDRQQHEDSTMGNGPRSCRGQLLSLSPSPGTALAAQPRSAPCPAIPH